MANPLKVTRLDSPLQGLRRPDDETAAPTDPPPAPPPEGPLAPAVVAREPEAAAARPRPRRRRAAERRPELAAPPRDGAAWPPAEGFWPPPALDERVGLVSTRLPVSLSRALERHTRALRDRHDLASQKALPMQEVLALAVWALGDPDDEAAAERVDAIYRSYRARRMAAAANALEQR